MAVSIPIVGRLYNRVSPRIFVSSGVVLVAASAYLMARYTLETSAASIVGTIVLQGFGFSCLFVPLTTVSLGNIPRFRLADAAGLNSLLRQIGGSLGLAAFATLLPRYIAQAQVGLAAHVVPGRPEVVARLAGAQGFLESRGLDHAAAAQGSIRLLAGAVARQAAVIAFEHMFLLAGVGFLFVLPLTLFLKVKRADAGPAPQVDVH
jgi:DHA2 family multidrug resistance protein